VFDSAIIALHIMFIRVTLSSLVSMIFIVLILRLGRTLHHSFFHPPSLIVPLRMFVTVRCVSTLPLALRLLRLLL